MPRKSLMPRKIMILFRNTAILLLSALFVCTPILAATPKKGGTKAEEKPHQKKESIVWSETQHKQTGLYTTKNYFVSNGVSLGFNLMYYYGDVDNMGWGTIVNGGFNVKNLSLGGLLGFGYLMPLGNCCNLRFNLGAGRLNADNTEMFKKLDPPRTDYRKFESWFIQPSVGVEYYPFWNAGFYLYGGLAITTSVSIKYDFTDKKGNQYTGNTFGILPMLQLGLGYSISLTQSWTLNIELLAQQGLCDYYYMNLDAYPLHANQNEKLKAEGRNLTNGREIWSDGWLQFGITVSYRWRNCEKCRLHKVTPSYRRGKKL